RICLGSAHAALPLWLSHLLPPVTPCTPPNLCIPFAVVAMEGMLFFAILRTTELLRAPAGVKPFLAGLVALNLDPILDPVAASSVWCTNGPNTQALGFWTWFTSSTDVGYWYGIPFLNYTAWFCSVFAFTLSVHLGRRYLQNMKAEIKVDLGLWIAFL